MVDVLGMLEYRERKSDQNKIIVTIVDVDYDEACEGEILGIRAESGEREPQVASHFMAT
jgi:hypothetical protein